MAKTLETLSQTLVEEVEAGPEEDAGTVVKTTTIEGIRGYVEASISLYIFSLSLKSKLRQLRRENNSITK